MACGVVNGGKSGGCTLAGSFESGAHAPDDEAPAAVHGAGKRTRCLSASAEAQHDSPRWPAAGHVATDSSGGRRRRGPPDESNPHGGADDQRGQGDQNRLKERDAGIADVMVFSIRAYVLEVLAPCKRTHAVSGRQPLTTTPPPERLSPGAC